MRHRRAVICGSAVAVVLSMLGIFGCDAHEAASGSVAQGDLVARGQYLVTIGGCNDCHTPLTMGPNGPEPDMTQMLAGHPAAMTVSSQPGLTAEWMWAGTATNTAFAGPWGVSYSANLTPDRETGIGIWSEEQFRDTIRSGKHWGVDRPIMPPMPWQNFAQMTDGDFAAVYAYLKTIPAVKNAVPRAVIAEGPPPGTNPAASANPGSM